MNKASQPSTTISPPILGGPVMSPPTAEAINRLRESHELKPMLTMNIVIDLGETGTYLANPLVMAAEPYEDVGVEIPRILGENNLKLTAALSDAMFAIHADPVVQQMLNVARDSELHFCHGHTNLRALFMPGAVFLQTVFSYSQDWSAANRHFREDLEGKMTENFYIGAFIAGPHDTAHGRIEAYRRVMNFRPWWKFTQDSFNKKAPYFRKKFVFGDPKI